MTELAYGTPEEAGMDAGQIAELHERAAEWVDGIATRTAVMLVARRGKIVFHEAYGPLTGEPDAALAGRDAIFGMSSITKVIVATAVMQLVEDGLIGLNRPLTEYFPEIGGPGTADVEIQHLLTHTSGFREEECWAHHAANLSDVNASPATPGNGQHQFIADYLNRMEEVASHFMPGSLMHYCSHNYILLADLVRRISGQSTEDFVRKRFFEPLGMEGTSLVRDDARASRQVVRGEGLTGGSTTDGSLSGLEDLWFGTAPWGHAGANACAMDLAIWGQTILNGGTYGSSRLLSKASIREMTRDQLPGIGAEINDIVADEASWGLGWIVQGNTRHVKYSSTLVPMGALWHTGAGGNMFWIDKANDLVGVYLSVTLIPEERSADYQWAGDLFMNMATAAVVDRGE